MTKARAAISCRVTWIAALRALQALYNTGKISKRQIQELVDFADRIGKDESEVFENFSETPQSGVDSTGLS